MTVQDSKETIAASIWVIPATFEQLVERFSGRIQEYFLWQYVVMLRQLNWIYEEDEVYYAYKKTAKLLNRRGYGLDLKEEYKSEFVKQFERESGL